MCPFFSISVHSQRQKKVAGKPTHSCGGETRSSTSNENVWLQTMWLNIYVQLKSTQLLPLVKNIRHLLESLVNNGFILHLGDTN